MNTTRDCGCKGHRSCLVCEEKYGLDVREVAKEKIRPYLSDGKVYHFCPDCSGLYKTTNNPGDPMGPMSILDHDNHPPCEAALPGVKIVRNFISEEEEKALAEGLDQLPWDASQSGRRKQNFGPKANFRKRKVKLGADFVGFPECTKFVQDRFHEVRALAGFRTVEQCSIEYRQETGSHIDPHVDDCWVWGERVVQLHLLSDSVLSLIPFDHRANPEKYNLQDVSCYPRVLDADGEPCDFQAALGGAYELRDPARTLDGLVRVPLPRRSLLVLYGEPRYQWEHFVLRQDIHSRRVIIAYREFPPPYLPGGDQEAVGREILTAASRFWS